VGNDYGETRLVTHRLKEYKPLIRAGFQYHDKG